MLRASDAVGAPNRGKKRRRTVPAQSGWADRGVTGRRHAEGSDLITSIVKELVADIVSRTPTSELCPGPKQEHCAVDELWRRQRAWSSERGGCTGLGPAEKR